MSEEAIRAKQDARPDLILLPGLLCDDELWRDQISALSNVAHCHVADLTHEETIDRLAASILSKAPTTFALAGFSFGGYVAQEIARQAPNRIERLALLDTSIRADTPQRTVMRRALGRFAQLPGAFRGVTDRMLSTFIHPNRLADRALVDRITSMTRRVGREVFLRQNAMQRSDSEGVLRALKCPIFVICGDEDRLTPLADHQELVTMLQYARLVTILESGHMTPMERPAAVSAALRDWLTWCPSSMATSAFQIESGGRQPIQKPNTVLPPE